MKFSAFKNFLAQLLAAIMVVAIFYLPLSFCAWSLNLSEWPWLLRLALLIGFALPFDLKNRFVKV